MSSSAEPNEEVAPHLHDVGFCSLAVQFMSCVNEMEKNTSICLSKAALINKTFSKKLCQHFLSHNQK